MKKEKKVVYGIEITKPWSAEMYEHNEAVAEIVREEVLAMWNAAVDSTAFAYGVSVLKLSEFDWDQASGGMKVIQTAVTVYGFGYGYDVARVSEIVMQDLEDAPFYRLNEIVDDLGIELKKGFVGFN